jgi:hypothetical protein
MGILRRDLSIVAEAIIIVDSCRYFAGVEIPLSLSLDSCRAGKSTANNTLSLHGRIDATVVSSELSIHKEQQVLSSVNLDKNATSIRAKLHHVLALISTRL